ncbi:hypothetical protein AMATHDRAFT_77711 [Amanita thiersii Skay4041]|uniref:AMP-dependent synthetase/ligase domain-containing protein n=1 Tax=Amanita thiersii Skay4041 TaxID=703135 RepID=A0A2A9N7Y8_9AGAR|nr:hypothetical protein AMATHDRAFT_77711 [Amanita thiersii Skay4041]
MTHIDKRLQHFTRTLLTLSSTAGPTNPPLDTRTLPEYFTSHVLHHYSQRPALICRSEKPRSHGGPPSRNMDVTRHLSWDYEEFERHIAALARGLVSMGVEKGDRVGVIMGNNSAYAVLQWACARIGAILVTINPAYRLQELVSTLNLVSVQHLFIVPRVRSSAYLYLLSSAFPSLRSPSSATAIQEPAFPSLRNLVVVDNADEHRSDIDNSQVRCATDWREIMVWREGSREGQEVQRRMDGLKSDEVINLQFTSGTTGLPKAVSLTHTNLLNNGLSIAKCMNLTEQDVLCNVPPLFHCFDEFPSLPIVLNNPNLLFPSPYPRLVLGNLAAWVNGACIVYPSPVFDPAPIVDALQYERCTALHGVPTHFYGILAEVATRKSGSGLLEGMERLRTGIAAGSPIPIDLMKRLISEMGLRELTNAYGMSDPVSFQTTYADPLDKRVETVGKVQPHVRAKVLDSEGNVVPVGVPGEICVSGYLLQKGYWNDEEQTEKVMRRDEEGRLWMYTGDEGIMDGEGYLRVVGRIKDIIIRGGENLFPVQIENALTTDEGILEAAAVAVPDEKYGEVVGAWIVRRPGAAGSALTREEVRQAVTARMNPQNAPAWVWFVGEGEEGAYGELPKTASGKVQKHVLRGWSRELAGKGVGSVRR